MAQGTFKKTGTSKATGSILAKKHQKKEGGPKKREGKYIAPKSHKLITQKNLQKKLAAKSIVQTEQLMAARAGATGKLTIMKTVRAKAKEELEKSKKGKK